MYSTLFLCGYSEYGNRNQKYIFKKCAHISNPVEIFLGHKKDTHDKKDAFNKILSY